MYRDRFFVILFFCATSLFSQNWDETQKIVSSDRDEEDRFGNDIAIDGNTLIVAARGDHEDSNGQNPIWDSGSVYIYNKSGNGTWEFSQKITSPIRHDSDLFGEAIAISGDYLIVGAKFDDEDENEQNSLLQAGSVYIFERDSNGNWQFFQKIVASDREGSDAFGTSVDIFDDIIVVGTPLENDDVQGNNQIIGAGSAYIFERNTSGLWEETQKIVASDRGLMEYFGADVATNGNYVMVGAYNAGILGDGLVYAFKKNANDVWEETQMIVGSDVNLDSGNDFGISVEMDNASLIVGASNQDFDAGGGVSYTNAGAAYIFNDNGSGIWEEDGKVVPQDPEDNGLVGFSVDISGIFAIAGGYRVNTNELGNEILTDAGAAYVYKREGFNNWVQVRKIVAAEREAMDYAGYSVALYQSDAFFSAVREDHDENGNSFLLNSGSVFNFKGNENYYLDNDGDGVSNAQESNDNTNINDPCSLIVINQTLDTSTWDIIDCDGDGLLNYEEVDQIDDPSTPPIPIETTNPLDPCDPVRGPDYLDYDSSNPIWQIFDCDDDGLVNLEEFNLGTDPYDEDTDDDNFTDFEEITCGSDPLDVNETCETLNLSLNNKIKFALFPNPVQGVLHINFENLQSEIELKIFDTSGKELIKERFYHTKNLIIDLPFDAGVYFLNILSQESGQTNTVLLIKE